MRYFYFFIFLFLSNVLIAQESFNYQANILTKEGLPAANRQFRVNIKISNDSSFISNSYQEIVNVKSGNYGYITFEIGKNGQTNLLSAVQWNVDVYIDLQITTTDNLERIEIPIKHKLNYSPKSIYSLKAENALVSDIAYKAINADTSQYNFVSQWSAKADSAKHAINADTSQYNFISKWSAKTDSAKHAINADTSQYNFISQWSAKSDSAKHAINADTSQYNFVSKWSAKTDSAKHAVNADTSQYNFISQWSAKSDSAKHAINADTSQYNFVSQWSAKSDSAKHAINADTSQYNFVSQWSAKSDSALHAVNADTSQYTFVSKWSAKADSAKHAVNADTSQYNFVSQWSAKTDSAKHAINADTSQYTFVSKWSAKSDSAKHAVNADTSQYNFISQWSAKSDSAKHAVNADTAKFASEKFGIGMNPVYNLDVNGFGRFVADQSPLVGPELRFKGYRQEWVMGVDVANNGGSGDFVMLADQVSNGSVRDLIYVNRNKEGDNSINDDSGFPTIGFWYTPSSKDVQTMFNVPDVKPNRDIVGIRKSQYTANSSKMLSFYDSADTIADFWVNSIYQFEPFLMVKGDLSVLSKDINNTSVLRLNANPSDSGNDFIFKNFYSGGTGYEFRLSNAGIEQLKINPYKNTAAFNGIVLANAGVDTLATKAYNRSLFENDINVTGNLRKQGKNVITEADTSVFSKKLVSINSTLNNYTLSLTDLNNMVTINSSSGKTITIPINSSVPFPVGSKILVTQMGAGQITFLTDVGVILNSADAANKTKTQYSVATLIKTDTNTWLLFGDIIN